MKLKGNLLSADASEYMVQSRRLDFSFDLSIGGKNFIFVEKNLLNVIDCTDLQDESSDPEELPEYSERSPNSLGPAKTNTRGAKHEISADK